MSSAFRGTGKTTRVLEQAIEILGRCPEGEKILVVGAHRRWVMMLEQESKSEGLVDVDFTTYLRLASGGHRGRRYAAILFDDFDAAPTPLRHVLDQGWTYLSTWGLSEVADPMSDDLPGLLRTVADVQADR